MDNQSGHDRDVPQCNLMGTVYKPGSTKAGAGGVTVMAIPPNGGSTSTTTGSDGKYSMLVERPLEGSDPIHYRVQPDVMTTQGAQMEVVAYDTNEITGIDFNEVER